MLNIQAILFEKYSWRIYSSYKSFLIFSRIDRNNAYITIINNSDSDIVFTFKNESQSLITTNTACKFTVKRKSSDIIKSNIINQIEF